MARKPSERSERPAPEGNETLKLLHESKLAAGALEVVELGVGLALFVHHHQLRTEAEEREAPVVEGGAEAAGAVPPRGAILHDGNQRPSLS